MGGAMSIRAAPFQRVFDLAIALPLALAVFLPCLVLLAAIRLESAGSPLFVQTRVGRGQRPFAMYKLRTMGADTAHGASHEIGTASITRLGAILRRLKLDELPQLINVIRGDMSLVGPRPCLPSQTALVNARERLGLYAIRPGVTGAAQLAGIDMSDPERLAAVEAEYYATERPVGDWPTLWRTFAGGGRGDAAAVKGTRP
jgi:lipopolysaccharide/colanic/teichoic acid biosynthesis glycosyltransferase